MVVVNSEGFTDERACHKQLQINLYMQLINSWLSSWKYMKVKDVLHFQYDHFSDLQGTITGEVCH